MTQSVSDFGIETEEYEQPRHVFEMCQWINAKLAQMEEADNFDTLYFERKGNNVKKLIEEAIPISRLGLYFSSPANDVYIQCFAGNQPFDATLRITGFRTLDIKVEATTVETEDSTIRRHALSRNGFAYTSGPTQRDGRNVTLQPEFVDLDEQDEEWADLAFDRVLDKLGKSYGPETAILVHVDRYRPISLERRAALIRRTYLHLQSISTEVYGVYYSYMHGLRVDSVRRGDSI